MPLSFKCSFKGLFYYGYLVLCTRRYTNRFPLSANSALTGIGLESIIENYKYAHDNESPLEAV